MTFSLIEPVRPEKLLELNRRLVNRALGMGHINPAMGAAAVLYTYQLERELASDLIEPELAVRQARVMCRAACVSQPDRTEGGLDD